MSIMLDQIKKRVVDGTTRLSFLDDGEMTRLMQRVDDAVDELCDEADGEWPSVPPGQYIIADNNAPARLRLFSCPPPFSNCMWVTDMDCAYGQKILVVAEIEDRVRCLVPSGDTWWFLKEWITWVSP